MHRARPAPRSRPRFAFRADEHLRFLLTQFVNALSQSALLFFLGVGLTLIFGLMRIVNFAHGALYMLGAFVGYSLGSWTGNYWLALAGAPVLVGLSERRSSSPSCAGSTGAMPTPS